MNTPVNFKSLVIYPRDLYRKLVSHCLEDFDNLIEESEMIADYYRTIAAQQKELDEIGKGGIVDNDYRAILHDDRYIYVRMKTRGIDVYTDYTPDLYSYLTRPKCCSYKFNDDGYLQMEIKRYNGGKTYSPSFHRFLYYYREMNLDAEIFANQFKDINERSNDAGINIDHACNDIHINCGWNLSAVSKRANNIKTNLIAQIKPPYYCLPVVTRNGEYRVEYGIINFGQGECHHVLCRDIWNLVSFLKSFIGAHSNEYIMRKYGSPAERYAHDKHAPFFADSFDTMSSTAERLLSMDEENFTIWNSDMGSGDIFLRD